MTPNTNDLLKIRRETLVALKALDGTHWQSARGELHLQNLEMPNWIIMRSSDDLAAAHRAFVAIYEPHFAGMGAVQATVSYTRGNAQLEFFETNDAIRAALADPTLGGARDE